MSIRTKVAAAATALMLAFTPTAAVAQSSSSSSPLPGGMSSHGSSGNPSGQLVEGLHDVRPYGPGLRYEVIPTQNARSLSPWNGWSVDPSAELEAHGIPATPTMVKQFQCHAVFTSGKDVWALEDYRPVTSTFGYLITGCNP